MYAAVWEAFWWRRQNLHPEASKAVVVPTDGEDANPHLGLRQQFGDGPAHRLCLGGLGGGGGIEPPGVATAGDAGGGYHNTVNRQRWPLYLADLQLEF
ncbi:MAG: hypothetical protein Q6K14_00260 [Gloeomargarita sp. GMQP_bins_44]